MKQRKQFLLLLCALTVLLGGVFAARQFRRPASVSETDGYFALASHPAEDLTAIAWTCGGTACSFLYTDGVWQPADDPARSVRQDLVQTLADTLTGLQATRKLEEVKNLTDYGLETPDFTVTAYWKDGSSTVYSTGDATPFADGYFVRLSDRDDVVYTVASSLSDLFGKAQKELAAIHETSSSVPAK